MQALQCLPTWTCVDLHSACLQADINEVNKIAHTIKARLEKLDGDNAKALKQPVGAAESSFMDSCAVYWRLPSACCLPVDIMFAT